MGKGDSKLNNKLLFFITVLHGFTHLYMVALIPLYLLIEKDFNLPGTSYATALVTIQMMAYFLPSIYIGKLADKFDRIKLLAIGLLINSIAFVGLGMAKEYWLAVVFVILAGFGGSFFHPAGIALIAKLYPQTTGRALGIAGIGASIGFFLGPLYPGWRAGMTGNWRSPIIEIGLVGLIFTIIFILFNRKNKTGNNENIAKNSSIHLTPHPVDSESVFSSYKHWIIFVVACLLISLRDFAGGGMTSLTSLFLQNAHGWSLKHTGLALGLISLVSGISNPLFGHISDKARYKSVVILILISSFIIGIFPRVPSQYSLVMLPLYGFFFMATYPIVEAALVQTFPDNVRGRVCGVFLTVCSIIGNLAHWVSGRWFSDLGDRARSPENYYNLYLILGILAVLSLLGLYFLRNLKQFNKKECEAIVLKNSACELECK